MPITYALNMFGLSFSTLTALLVWVTLEHRHVMVQAAKRIPTVVMESLPWKPKTINDDETGAPEVPMWWYLVCCVVAIFMSIFAVEYWHVGLRWYGVLLALAIAAVFFPPVSTTLFHKFNSIIRESSHYIFSLPLCMRPPIRRSTSTYSVASLLDSSLREVC